MECFSCDGSGRKPLGFFTIDCSVCFGKGYLDIDDIWEIRLANEEDKNISRLMDWREKYNAAVA